MESTRNISDSNKPCRHENSHEKIRRDIQNVIDPPRQNCTTRSASQGLPKGITCIFLSQGVIFSIRTQTTVQRRVSPFIFLGNAVSGTLRDCITRGPVFSPGRPTFNAELPSRRRTSFLLLRAVPLPKRLIPPITRPRGMPFTF